MLESEIVFLGVWIQDLHLTRSSWSHSTYFLESLFSALLPLFYVPLICWLYNPVLDFPSFLEYIMPFNKFSFIFNAQKSLLLSLLSFCHSTFKILLNSHLFSEVFPDCSQVEFICTTSVLLLHFVYAAITYVSLLVFFISFFLPFLLIVTSLYVVIYFWTTFNTDSQELKIYRALRHIWAFNHSPSHSGKDFYIIKIFKESFWASLMTAQLIHPKNVSW